MKSWLKYTLRTAAILLTATLLTTSCLQSDFDEPLLAGDTVKVSFNVGVDNDMVTRVGEGGSINSLLVAIYKQDETFVSADNIIDDVEVNGGKISDKLSFELLRNQNYKAVFFAYNSAGYTVSSDRQTITANYGVGVSNPELLDAFRGAIDFTATANTSLSTTLTRAVALFVVGAKNENFESGDVTLLLKDAPTAFRTLTGKTTTEKSDISLTFTPNGSKVDGNDDYTLLAMTYVLPGKITPTITTGNDYKQVANAITFAANKRYNLLGNSLFVNSSWGGEIKITSLPAENVRNGWIHIKTAEELAYLIKNGDSATVAAGANISSTRAGGVKKYHICPGTDLDMSKWKDNYKPTTAVSFTNTIIDAGKWDGDAPTVDQTCEDGCYTIEGLTLANGIFGNAIGVTVQNLNIEGATIGSNTAEGVGIIANTATGSLTLTNITVSGTVTGKNKVGGLVGYISNSKDNEATISNCHSTATITINNESDNTNHDIFVGGLVGCFRGDTKDEVLTFEGNCSANETGYFTPFCDDEKACFNSDCTVIENLLGGEEYCRGSVYYGESRFFYRWDGVRSVKPIFDGEETDKKVFIYSPYDLAYLQGDEYKNTVSSMTFYNDVDMGGTDEELEWDGNTIRTTVGVDFARRFTPIRSVKDLTGNNCTIHNLRVQMTHDGDGAGLIQNISGGTVKDLTINKAYIFNDNDWSLNIPVYPTVRADITDDNGKSSDNKGQGNAYAGTLATSVSYTTTVSNVHITNGKVFAICKMGGLIGRLTGDSGTAKIENCSVNECYLQNYEANVPNYYTFPSEYVVAGGQVNLLQWWYTHGEVGGLIGFVQHIKADINSCSVTNTNLNCFGQPDKTVTANLWGNEYDSANQFAKNKSVTATGNTIIAGRHVNQFIGEVVSQRSEARASSEDYTVTISDYYVSGNNYIDKEGNVIAATSTEGQKYGHNYKTTSSGNWWNPTYTYYYCDVVGSAYYVGVDININAIVLKIEKHIQDCAGKLIFNAVNSSPITVTENMGSGGNIDWTGGNFDSVGIGLLGAKSKFPDAPSTITPVGGYSKTDPRSGN